jgi:drug/metabolite transporter (DMT)-like permease
MGQHLLSASLILASASCTVIANLTLKLGTQQHGLGKIWPLSVLNLRVLAAAVAFAAAFLFYAMLLKRLPLSLAQAIMSMQFVLVILAANVLLHEEIGAVRWIGISCMAIGLIIIGLAPGPTR